MSTRLRDVAVQHLRSLAVTMGEGAVRRLTMDIEVEGRVELVTLALRNDELQCVSSDGRNDGPHVMAALKFIAGTESREASSPPGEATPVADSQRGDQLPAAAADVDARADARLAEILAAYEANDPDTAWILLQSFRSDYPEHPLSRRLAAELD